MARLSQYRPWMLGSISLLTTGCVVPDAPEYGVANQTPVFVDASSISPNPRTVQHYKTTPGSPPLDFHFIVRSEDAGDDLVTAIYIDYNEPNSYVDHRSIPASTFDVPRTVAWTLDTSTRIVPSSGCHVISVTVLHSAHGWDNDTNEQIGTPPDLAVVSWFATFNDDAGVVPLSACPDPSTDSSGTTR